MKLGTPRALLGFVDTTTFIHRQRLAELALRHAIASQFDIYEFVEAGALMAYGPSFKWLYRRAAFYVARVLNGARPANLAIEQPTKFELAINLKTAKALGLTVPPSVLGRADQVIEWPETGGHYDVRLLPRGLAVVPLPDREAPYRSRRYLTR